MSLSTSLNNTAISLVDKYGNSSVLKSKTNSTYNPQTGKYDSSISTSYNIKAISSTATIESMRIAGISDLDFGKIKLVYTVAYNSDYDSIDTNWTIDNYHINKIVKSKAQDNNIVFKLFVG